VDRAVDEMRKDLADELTTATNASGTEIASAALIIARVEYPRLEAEPYLTRLDQMGEAVRHAIDEHADAAGETSPRAVVRTLNEYLFEELQFAGSQMDKYEDPRNSCLNQVIDRRIGIPITLAVLYMEVARRAGVQLHGVNFPGHFLVRYPDSEGTGLIIDPFHGGVLLSEQQCRVLLQKHCGREVAFTPTLLAPATRLQIVVRMLLNLKKLYVHMRSFPQARDVTELLLTITPSALSELRDRGLLAYHLNDVTGALRDLQTYLKLTSMGEMDKEAREEHQQIWEHVKTLRRRVAALN
jgi:regulator of sirC expression with transglutaminase-like and TPR domain